MTGYSQFISYLSGLNSALVLFFLNFINITLSFILGTRKLGFKAVYGFIFIAIFIELTRTIFNLEQTTNPKLIDNTLPIFLNALGSAIGVMFCIKTGYSTGSFSTLYLVVKKYYPVLSAPFFMSSLDIVLILLTLRYFSLDKSLMVLINTTIFILCYKFIEKYAIKMIYKLYGDIISLLNRLKTNIQ